MPNPVFSIHHNKFVNFRFLGEIMRVLFVEDENYIAEAVEQVFKKNNISVDLAFDGEYGLDCALCGIYDVIILDIMLPKLDGLSILRQIRNQGIKTPVMLLTARGDIDDKVQGLNLGADDYLSKPFHKEELLARVQALSRRVINLIPNGVLHINGLELNPNTLFAMFKNNEIKLTLKEAQILELLIRNKGFTLSKEIIIDKVWGYDSEEYDGNVETHISLLRKKLAKLKSSVSIRTIRGVGYTICS